MSPQIFLQGKILGIEGFLQAASLCRGLAAEDSFAVRSLWVTLLGEILPRALLAEMGLARILLGASGGGQFLLVLPGEIRGRAEEFLSAAGGDVDRLSGGRLRLSWAITENLGDWTIVRRRMAEEMAAKRGNPLAAGPGGFFEPFDAAARTAAPEDDYFTAELLEGLRRSESAGWNPDSPARILPGQGKHVWSVSSGSPDAIALARHAAPSDDGFSSAGVSALGARAEGLPAWGLLRGDVDNFGSRLRRAQTIEEHVQLSVMYKQLFAGELEVACSMPEFWRRVTILYSGGDDFAVFGAWDALIQLARELHRLFHRFSDEMLKDFPGPEGKTITMAMAIAGEPGGDLAAVYRDAGERLEFAKSSGKDCFHLLGKTLEWKHMGEAAEFKDLMVRLVREFGCSPVFLQELAGFYREASPHSSDDAPAPRTRVRVRRFDRPWRFHRRLNRLMTGSKDKEFQKLRTSLIAELLGRGSSQRRLRPAGRVALEWARLATGV